MHTFIRSYFSTISLDVNLNTCNSLNAGRSFGNAFSITRCELLLAFTKGAIGILAGNDAFPVSVKPQSSSIFFTLASGRWGDLIDHAPGKDTLPGSQCT